MKKVLQLLAATVFLGINTAFAAAPAGAEHKSGFLGMLPMLIIFVVVFYFLLVRPQSKRAKQHKQLVAGIKAGDEVVSAGGIMGVVRKIEDNVVDLEIASGTVIKMQKGSLSSVLPKGSVSENAKDSSDSKEA